MLTLLAFLVTIGVLVTVHEWGHYRVAHACGVKVLRFSIGMGWPLLRWRGRGAGAQTEFVIAALPLGGYVRMLDERVALVAPVEQHHAFNRQPVGQRAAIMLAGPLANLVLAVLFFSVANWWGMQVALPVVSTPPAGSLAAEAGLRQGDQVLQVRLDGAGRAQPLRSFDELRWTLYRAALNHRDLELQLQSPDGAVRTRQLPLAALQLREIDDASLGRIGILAPAAPPRVVEVLPGGAAAAAGVQAGDVVLGVDGHPIGDMQQLIDLIVAAGAAAAGDGALLPVQRWTVQRGAQQQELNVNPRLMGHDGHPVAEAGVRLTGGDAFAATVVRYGPLESAARGLARTWEMSVLTLKMFWRMLVGEASLKNLSGPVSIAQYAGQSASQGVVQFLNFLGLVSLSLGMFNLLPLPVLDGGHLMYYLWEAVTGRPMSLQWLERLQLFGVVALLMLMGLTFLNDVERWLS